MTRANAYGRAVLDNEAVRLAAIRGGRNNAANAAGFAVGRVIEATGLDVDAAAEALTEAARQTGLPSREAAAAVRSGLRAGLKAPKEIPASSRRTHRVAAPVVASPVEPRIETPQRTFPPADEVNDLILDSRPTAEDDEVASWLVSRGLDPDRVDAECAAAALPRSLPIPKWAYGPDGPWTSTGHRLLLPALDAAGRRVTVRARRVTEGGGAKTLSPAKHTHAGTVFADLIAHQALAGSRTADRWLIVEGDADFLTWTTRRAWERPTPVAVLGLYSGSWTQALADRIPSGARVALRLHDDAAGEKYRAAVVASLHGRVELHQRRACA